MKRIIVLCLCGILCFSACGKEQGTGNVTGADSVSPTPTRVTGKQELTGNSTSTSNEAIVEEDIYEDSIKVRGREIYCDYLKGRRTEGKSSSTTFYAPPRGNETDTVMLVADYENQYKGDLSGVIDYFNGKLFFLDLALYYGTGFLNAPEGGWIMEIDSTAPVTIKENNLDTIQFTGHVVNDQGTSCYLYGYSFIKNEMALMLLGVVHSPGQEQEIIERIENEVDAMIITVRDELFP